MRVSHLTLVIEETSPQELFKDISWPDQVKGLWHNKPLISPVYDVTENHDGIECDCCTRIIHESYTCPTKAERLAKPQRGRPKTNITSVNSDILSDSEYEDDVR
jgi:hypothetical protein